MSTHTTPPKRASNTHLPGRDEMSLIAAAEMQRPLAPDKEGVRYVEFDTIEALCVHFDLPADVFELDEKKPEEILDTGGKLLDELVTKVISKIPTDETLHLLKKHMSI